jgi:hypothetical protein
MLTANPKMTDRLSINRSIIGMLAALRTLSGCSTPHQNSINRWPDGMCQGLNMFPMISIIILRSEKVSACRQVYCRASMKTTPRITVEQLTTCSFLAVLLLTLYELLSPLLFFTQFNRLQINTLFLISQCSIIQEWIRSSVLTAGHI